MWRRQLNGEWLGTFLRNRAVEELVKAFCTDTGGIIGVAMGKWNSSEDHSLGWRLAYAEYADACRESIPSRSILTSQIDILLGTLWPYSHARFSNFIVLDIGSKFSYDGWCRFRGSLSLTFSGSVTMRGAWPKCLMILSRCSSPLVTTLMNIQYWGAYGTSTRIL